MQRMIRSVPRIKEIRGVIVRKGSCVVCERCEKVTKKIGAGFLVKNYTSTIRELAMAACTKTLDKHKCSSASTAAVCMRETEECAHCCEGLGKLNCSITTQK